MSGRAELIREEQAETLRIRDQRTLVALADRLYSLGATQQSVELTKMGYTLNRIATCSPEGDVQYEWQGNGG